MTKTTARNGSYQVKTISNRADGPFWSRLYVNHGETATNISATHSTLKGAERWAQRAVAQ